MRKKSAKIFLKIKKPKIMNKPLKKFFYKINN